MMEFNADHLLRLIGKQQVMIDALQTTLKEERERNRRRDAGTADTTPPQENDTP